VTKNPEKIYPSFGTVDMNRGYKISPEAGDISHVFDEDASEDWTVKIFLACRKISAKKSYYSNRARKGSC